MKTEKSILTAFILNLGFSIFELLGGFFTGSIAILSDSVHDLGDALSIGISYLLEKKSKKSPDEVYTYGYGRFSVLGGFITTVILVFGSVIVLINAVARIFNPVELNYNGMIFFALVGVVVNSVAAYVTLGGESLNKKAVNLHMLEDVLGWITVLIGAIIMRFTDVPIIDPLMSAVISIFITVRASGNLKKVGEIFLEKCPDKVNVAALRESLFEIDGVSDVHHIHIRSFDGHSVYFTAHIEAEEYSFELKEKIRHRLKEKGIAHATLEFEERGEKCGYRQCYTEKVSDCGCSHGHHHRH